MIAVGLSVLALRGQDSSRASGTTLDPSSSTSLTVVDTADATQTADPADATATPADDGPTVHGWTEAWTGDSDLLVVGDGFSNLPSQWVQLWADGLGEDRPVTIRHWGESADVSFNDPIELSDGDGSPLTVWSASRDGSTIHDAAERYQRFVDASASPDAVLVSMGLDSGDEDIAGSLDELVAEIDETDEDVPVLVAIGPDGLYDEGVADALLEWAQEHADRVAVVDLRGQAPDEASAEQWAAAFEKALDRP